jgi:hypothetical protein
MDGINFQEKIRTNYNNFNLLIRRLEEKDVEPLFGSLNEWKNKATNVSEEIRKGAINHFNYYISSHSMHLNSPFLFIIAEGMKDKKIYGVGDALASDNGGSIILSEKIQTLFRIPEMHIIEGLHASQEGLDLLFKFYYELNSEGCPYLSRTNFTRLQKDHPEYFI